MESDGRKYDLYGAVGQPTAMTLPSPQNGPKINCDNAPGKVDERMTNALYERLNNLELVIKSIQPSITRLYGRDMDELSQRLLRRLEAFLRTIQIVCELLSNQAS